VRAPRITGWIAAVLLAAPATATAAAGEPVPIMVSYQQGLYGSLPLYVATEKEWWTAVGLRPSFVTFPADGEQLGAGADQVWEVAATAPLSAILGADRFGLLTVGIADDASDASVVMARPKEVDAIFKRPAFLKGKELLATPETTAEYVARACLAKWRLQPEDMHVVAVDPADILAHFADRDGRIAALSAPDDYALFEKRAGITVCSGKNAGVMIPGALVARADFAGDHPERVARFLAVFLHAVAWQKTHRDETLALMRRFYSGYGIRLSDDDVAKEFDTRPTFALPEQLKLLDRSHGGVSAADGWYGRLSAYLVSAGAVQAPPLGESFLSERYVRWVAGDPVLKAFAEGE